MIIFEKIKLKNFRRYVDSEFTFSKNEINNVNVILARNGTGKSTLFDAITWCLFGVEDHLQIDSRYKDDSETILNSEIEFNLSKGDSVNVYVELSIIDTNEDRRYIIKRNSEFKMLEIGKIFYNNQEYLKDPEVLYYDKELNDWNREVNPSLIIENLIVPRDLRHFFFFDGERLGKHFEENSSEFIKDKVEKVSRLQMIDNCLSSIDSYLHKINKKQKNLVSDRNLKIKIQKRNELIEKINSYKEELKDLEERKKKIENRININKKEIVEIGFDNKNIDILNKEYSFISDEIDSLKEKINNLENLFKEKIQDYFLKKTFLNIIENSNKIIYKATENKEIPPPITRDYIDKILKREKCICGSNLDSNSIFRKNLEKFREETELINTSIDFNKGQFYFEKQIDLINKKEYLEVKKEIKRIKEELKYKEDKKEDLKNRIKKFDIEKINFLQNQIDENMEELERLKKRIFNKERDIDDYSFDLKKLEDEIKKGEKDNEKLNLLNKKKIYIENSKKVLENFRNYLIKKNLQKLKKNTELYLKEILIEKKDEISEIIIDEDYNLKIMSIYNKDLTSTLSKGESQIFVMSFAAALRDLMNLKTPFLIDTPLGRIDNEYRLEVTRSFPKILENSQFILLVTSSEYTSDVKEILKKISNGELVEYEVIKEGNKNKVVKNE